MSVRLIQPVALAALIGVTSALAARGDELTAKMEKALIGLKAVIDQNMETSVAVGDITADPELGASGGPAIAQALIEALEKFRLQINRKARLRVEGRYRLAKEPTGGKNSLRIALTVSDRNEGKTVTELAINIVDAATIMKLAGGTGEISGPDRQSQSDQVERALNASTSVIGSLPGAPIPNTRISAAVGSPFAVELLLKAGPGDYRARAAKLKEDQAFVSLQIDDVYGIRLINDSDRPVGVELSIDGLNMFAFSENPAERQSRLVLFPRSAGDVIGWYRDNRPQGSHEFLVGKAADAEAARLLPPSAARLGMITATFFAAWPRSEAPPRGESEDSGRSALGTLRGLRTDQKLTPVDFVIGKPKVAVTIRYDKPVAPVSPPDR